MPTIKPTKTVYTVGQYLNWQRQGELDLRPVFQRREVWNANAKSQFIDTLIKGYPVPIILLRQLQDLVTLSSTMEVIDGQQRLRTMLAFVDETALPDFDSARDRITVKTIHNSDLRIARKPFRSLPRGVQHDLLAYELSTHVFPADTGDEDVYRIFARLNSTGLRLKPQEIRNAEFHGAFKSLVYDLGYSHLDFWRDSRIFSDESIARMAEAEAVSEYLLLMIHGITAKSQREISALYREFDDEIPGGEQLRLRFEHVIESLDTAIGDLLPNSSFRRAALFYSLFAAVYDHTYGLGSPLRRKRAKSLPKDFAVNVKVVSDKIQVNDLPAIVSDAMVKATANKKKREQRHKYLLRNLKLEQSS